MRLEPRYRIWKAADLEGTRPTLSHVSVERLDDTHGLVIAADGYALAVVPCSLLPDDAAGTVHATSLRDALRAHRGADTTVTLEADHLLLPDGGRWPRRVKLTAQDAFPDWRKILSKVLTEPPLIEDGYALDVWLLGRIGKACNGRLMRLSALGSGPVLVEFVARDAEGQPVPPFGILMPAKVSALDKRQIKVAATAVPS